MQFEFELSDFIEKDRSTVGRTETARRRIVGACERAFDMAKDVAGEESPGHCGTVDRNERASSTRALGVNRTGDQLLARPARTLDQHCRRMPGNGGNFFANVLRPTRHSH